MCASYTDMNGAISTGSNPKIKWYGQKLIKKMTTNISSLLNFTSNIFILCHIGIYLYLSHEIPINDEMQKVILIHMTKCR